MKHLLFMRNSALLFIFFFLTPISWGCTCLGNFVSMNDSLFENAQIVFVGRVISVEKMHNSLTIRVHLKVTEAFKQTEIGDTIEILTVSDSGLCGLDINKNESWYFFINSNNNDTLWENMCGRSVKLTRKKRTFKQYGFSLFFYKKQDQLERKRFKRDRKFFRHYITKRLSKLTASLF